MNILSPEWHERLIKHRNVGFLHVDLSEDNVKVIEEKVDSGYLMTAQTLMRAGTNSY